MSTLQITKDGLTYTIELVRAGSGEQMQALLEQDADGYLLTETTQGRPRNSSLYGRIGIRKYWYKALAEALEVMEAELFRRENGSTSEKA